MLRNWLPTQRAFAVVFVCLTTVSHAEEEVTVTERAALLLKAMSFDRNLERRAGASLHIAIVHIGQEAGAASTAEAFIAEGKKGLKGLPVSAAPLAFTKTETLLKQIQEMGIDAIYVDPSASSALSSIQQVTRGKQVLSLGANRKLVEQGLSLGVYRAKKAARLVVNQRSAKIEGLDLAPAIKLISTIIK